MAFLETPRFPQCPSFGFVSQPRYSTTITRLAGGQEKRNRNWARPLYQYTATVGPRAENDVQALLEFWHAVGGMFEGFRFKDFADFKSCRVGGIVAATDQPLVAIGSSPETYQVTKRYAAGALAQDRPISKPVEGSILVAADGAPLVETTDYSIDYTTGIVSFTADQSGAVLTWGGEFDVPVRFDSEFPVELLDQQIQSVTFALMELRL